MAGGSFRAPFFAVAWPTGEFGMGLEGALELGFREELDALSDPIARRTLAESRRWIPRALRSVPAPGPRMTRSGRASTAGRGGR